ncbi:ribosome maturation factor RimM [bacterium]|nr:ribosome maturation factor RimM [bacterium]
MSPPNPEEFRAIGKVVAAHGLQGTLKVDSWSDFDERFDALEWVFLRVEGREPERYKVVDVRFSSRYVLLKLDGLTRREQAEEFREAELLIPESESWPLPPNRYYVSELIGLEAVGMDETILGFVTDVITSGAQDILVVGRPHGELLIPIVDEWVSEVDIAAGKVRIANWQGLVFPEDSNDED